jgi:hypothetical protein
VIFGPLVIVVCAIAALAAPILIDAHHWWPRRFVAALFAAPVLAFVSLYVVDISTPGLWISNWLVPVIDDPSWAIRIVLSIIIDCSLWFTLIWAADSLLSSVRERDEMKLSWRLARASVCAFPLSLYATTGCAYSHSNAFSLLRSWFPLPACALVSFLLFFSLTLALYGVAMRFWPASWLRKVNPDDAKFTTLNLH